MRRSGLNDEIGQDPEGIEEWRHYPEEDVYDRKSGSQFYFHRHRDEEHGHFHLFHRPDKDNRPGRVKTPSHLMAISMDQQGVPIQLFTTNRWVTGERWRNAGKVLELARHFQVEHAEPALMLNRWITAMVSCCRPQLQALLLHRDQTIGKLRGWNWRRDAVFENRDLEVIGELALDLPAWREQLKSNLREKEPS